MTVDPIALQPFDEQEVSKLSARVASQTLEEPKDDDNDKPKASSSTPERKKLPQETEDGRKILFVAATSKAKSIAALIARIIRVEEGKPPVLSAVGAASVNQAVKAVAIAKGYLESNGINIAVDITRQPQDDVRDVIILKILKLPLEDETEAEVISMKSSAKSRASSMAGAIAANVRENKIPCITAIGKSAVFNAVCATSLARKYLQKENMDVTMSSKFTQVDFSNGAKANAIQLIVKKSKLLN